MGDETLGQGSVTRQEAGAGAGAEAEEVKSRDGHVTIKVQKEHTDDVFVRIKLDVPLRRLMLAYCNRLGVESAALRFTVDGSRVLEWHTPDGIGLEDGDVIDVWSDMSGGTALICL